MYRFLLLVFVAAAVATTAPAEEEPPSSLMERGARQFLEGLMQEMEPALESAMDFLDQMGPAMRDIMEEVKDWSVYEAPEILPNGDIIIRRKPDTPTETEPEPEPQIEL